MGIVLSMFVTFLAGYLVILLLVLTKSNFILKLDAGSSLIQSVGALCDAVQTLKRLLFSVGLQLRKSSNRDFSS